MEAITSFRPKLGSQLSLPSRTNLMLVSKLSRFPLTCYPGKIVHLRATATLTCNDRESHHTFKKLSPSEWGHHFLSVSVDVSEKNTLGRDIETLKPKVREILKSHSQGTDASKTRILFIYLLVSLGLAYLFENEIEEILKQDFQKVEDLMIVEDDLYKVSIIFLVFRTYGHNMSSDVFKRFQESNDKFKESLVGNVKGMLSLYEAAHLGTTTDYILDEALSFASSHLESLVASGNLPSHMASHIQNALFTAQHQNMEILVAVEFIQFYEQEDDHDEMLLKLSKLNFKFLQLHYLEELKIVTKWYKDLDFVSNLPPYFRDRIVEAYFFMPAMYPEPQSSRARIMMTKYYVIISLIDDTYDRYASIPDAESLANSFERWDLDDVMDKQPDYLKFIFRFTMETFKEFEREVGSYRVEGAIEEFKKFVKANINLAKWARAHVPSFEEYMKIGEVEIAVYGSMAALVMGIEQIPIQEAYEWLKSRPKLMRSLSTKARLMNDITGFKDDMNRGYAATGVNCYMKQYGVTEKEAIRELSKMVTKADKILNEEYMINKVSVPRKVWKVAMDLARTVHITYNGHDEYTNPEGKMKEYITSLFVNQFSL
uniref:Putative terpenoid synthase 7 n=1 Tax=Noccaea caerulescens TaxID=107243 RepID=A0A1J3FPS3_NOCCA